MKNTYEQQAKVFKALCDENRLHILELLREGELCACVLSDKLHIAQSTLSYHMKLLCESGIVAGEENGKWMHYTIDRAGCEHAQKLLCQLTSTKQENFVV